MSPFLFLHKNMLKLATKKYIFASVFVFVCVFSASLQPALAESMTAGELFEKVNLERADMGLSPLYHNILLEQAAQLKAQEMIKQQLFAHDLVGQPFYTFAESTQYNYKTLGENLAIDFMEANEVVTAWMHSPTHKANILNENFEDMGIAVVSATMHGVETTLVVQLFGASKDSLSSSQVAHYYDMAKEVTQTRQFGMAAVIAGTATLEASTVLSYGMYQLKRRRKKKTAT